MIELVIKIDEELYNDMKSLPFTTFAEDIIINGTPLPKHHGRLKDVDWIDENCNNHYSERDGSWCYTWRDIDNAPTIIEGSESK